MEKLLKLLDEYPFVDFHHWKNDTLPYHVSACRGSVNTYRSGSGLTLMEAIDNCINSPNQEKPILSTQSTRTKSFLEGLL